MRKLVIMLVLAVGAFAADPPSLPDWVKVHENISYSSYPETVLDVLESTRAGGKNRPGVVMIHGGGWVGGDRSAMIADCLRYLEKGYVVANINYRLAKSAPAPAAVEDASAAADWFRDNAKKYDVDRKKIVITGKSAGGHLALMVGLADKTTKLGDRNDFAAIINFYGITNVLEVYEGPHKKDWAVEWLRGADTTLMQRVSPVSYARKDIPPVLSIHGILDETVPYQQATTLTKVLRDEEADAELVPITDAGHGFEGATLERVYKEIFQFLERRGIK